LSDPVSWLLIEPGWRVISADGQQVGRVEEVTGDSNADIFDGLAVASTLWSHQRYVAAESVGEITQGEVHLTIDAAAMDALPKYEEPAESAEIEGEKASPLQRVEEHVVVTPRKAQDAGFFHRVFEWFGRAGKR
jgi:Uncharacterized protein conserved in bacteria (DUF2171)